MGERDASSRSGSAVLRSYLPDGLSFEGSSAISAFLGRGRRGPARPAAYVDGEHGPTCGEARVAVCEQRQGVYALGVLWVDDAAGAVCAYPPQFVPVVRVMV